MNEKSLLVYSIDTLRDDRKYVWLIGKCFDQKKSQNINQNDFCDWIIEKYNLKDAFFNGINILVLVFRNESDLILFKLEMEGN